MTVNEMQRKRFALNILFAIACVSTSAASQPPITAVAFSPNGKSVVAVGQAGIKVFSWPELKIKKTIEADSSNLHCVEFSPSGKAFAVGGGDPSEAGAVHVFSWPAADLLSSKTEHEDSVMSIAWRDDDRLVSASLDRDIKAYRAMPARDDSDSPNSISLLRGHSRGVCGLSLIREQNMLVSVGSDQSVRVWELSSSALVRSLSQHTKPINAVALRPANDGLPMVASAADDRTIRFWQPTIGRMVRYVRLQEKPLDIAWSTDGNWILAACVDGVVRVVDPTSVTVVHKVNALNGWAYAIAAHPNDGSFAVGGSDGQLRRLKLDGNPVVENTRE